MHILHLEDSATDAELIQLQLRSHWRDCTITVLASREKFEKAVSEGGFDLVLSDFSLPDYDGRSALSFVRSLYPDKPFIYLSGTIGEERAIEALKAGANDYLLKDRRARLIPAITTALAHVEHAEARRRTEQKVKEQAALLDKSREAICVIDCHGKVTYWNASAERLYGWTAPEACGRNLQEMLYGDERAGFDTACALALAGGEWRGELHPKPRQGSYIQVESFWSLVKDRVGCPTSILIIDADITEKRKMENQLMQAQRLETLGVLVGGIAHDLNNILAPFLLSVDMLRQRISADDRQLLDIMDASAHHGADLVRQLLAFARGDGEQRAEVAVEVLIGSVWKLLQRSMPSNIEMRAPLPNELWPVHADATQLRQVLLNLCLNARDAMPQGGTIEIRARNVAAGSAAIGRHPEARTGSYVCISVQDNGTGIPPGIMEKIFEPFFTTKQVGKGTGLGLANVAAIIKSHGGYLDVESRLGFGTTFHVHLPALHNTVGQMDSLAAHPPLAGRGERILVIESDADIHMVLEVILCTGGYQVTAATTGEEGLELLRTAQDAFAAVITELSIARKTGSDLFREIRALPGPPKILVLSDLPQDARGQSVAGAEIEFVHKSLTVENLLGTLHRMLETSPSKDNSCQSAATNTRKGSNDTSDLKFLG